MTTEITMMDIFRIIKKWAAVVLLLMLVAAVAVSGIMVAHRVLGAKGNEQTTEIPTYSAQTIVSVAWLGAIDISISNGVLISDELVSMINADYFQACVFRNLNMLDMAEQIEMVDAGSTAKDDETVPVLITIKATKKNPKDRFFSLTVTGQDKEKINAVTREILRVCTDIEKVHNRHPSQIVDSVNMPEIVAWESLTGIKEVIIETPFGTTTRENLVLPVSVNFTSILKTAALAAAAVCFVGYLAIFAMALLNPRVLTHADAAAALQLPVLAHMGKPQKSGVATIRHHFHPPQPLVDEKEIFALLSRLTMGAEWKEKRSFALVSVPPKDTELVAAGIAESFRITGRSVLWIHNTEASIEKPSGKVSDILGNGIDHKVNNKISLVPNGLAVQAKEFVERQSIQGEYTVVDGNDICQAGEMQMWAGICDGTILFVDGDTATPEELRKAKDDMERNGANMLGIIFRYPA